MIQSIFVSAITALITAIAAFHLQERKLKWELRTEFMAEQAVRTLLQHKKWQKRSFDEIKRRLGGFGEDELRKILVRAGAVSFEGKDGVELWGLVSRNEPNL